MNLGNICKIELRIIQGSQMFLLQGGVSESEMQWYSCKSALSRIVIQSTFLLHIRVNYDESGNRLKRQAFFPNKIHLVLLFSKLCSCCKINEATCTCTRKKTSLELSSKFKHSFQHHSPGPRSN